MLLEKYQQQKCTQNTPITNPANPKGMLNPSYGGYVKQ